MARRFKLCAVLLIVLAAVATAREPVEVRDGNVYLTAKDGHSIQITSSGMDSDPSLSLDQRLVVFVRRKPAVKIATGSGVTDKNELWMVSTSGKEPARRILTGHKGGYNIDEKLVLAGFSKPQFSPDGKLVYFLAQTWGTDNSARFVELATGKVHYLFAGNDLRVVQCGRYAGFLVALKDIPRMTTERVWRYWLMNGDGNDAGEIGETEADVDAFIDGQQF